MNIQLGIYDIFSAVIPGCVHLVAIFQLLTIMGVVQIDWKSLSNLSFFSAIFILIVAYLLGISFGRFGIIWYKIFKRKNQSLESLEEFRTRHKGRWNIDFRDEDWHILLAFLRTKDMDLAREIERHLATSIMLRNVSFGFFLLAVINLVQYFLVGDLLNIFASLAWFGLSLLMIRESIKSRRWYYDTILSTIVAQRIDLEKSITPVPASAKRTLGKRQNAK
jgi:hypothetical protein